MKFFMFNIFRISKGVFLVLLCLSTLIEKTSGSLKGQFVLPGENPAQRRIAIKDHSVAPNTQLLAIADRQEHLSDVSNVSRVLQEALETMQREFFELWLGTWPEAIDWTAAVMATHISATLHSITRSMQYSVYGQDDHVYSKGIIQRTENLMNEYYTQTTAYYFGQDAFALRTQAYDDMLWVVLGWLESIKLITTHNALHHKRRPLSDCTAGQANREAEHRDWFGVQFLPAFAHRANVFYSLVASGWDTSLCGGGLTWNPALTPYKNTITNTQFFAASIGMYLHHPGDDNSSPFINPAEARHSNKPGTQSSPNASTQQTLLPAKPHDLAYLHAAQKSYAWLHAVNLTNSHGLYVDGYHISDPHRPDSTPAQCDLRTEELYTYNQAVILSGLHGLWHATGNTSHLRAAHSLIRNVIAATNFALPQLSPELQPPQKLSDILGTDGILTERCDPSPSGCGQDAQAFKGIFFHHLTSFCEPLPTRVPLVPHLTFVADPATARLHRRSCVEYGPWVARNVEAALGTRDERGVFGGWWGAGRSRAEAAPGAVRQLQEESSREIDKMHLGREAREGLGGGDPNDRGRGRTLETHSGGLAVLRALRQILELRRESEDDFDEG